jgi:hypothetical protein
MAVSLDLTYQWNKTSYLKEVITVISRSLIFIGPFLLPSTIFNTFHALTNLLSIMTLRLIIPVYI